jgi:rhamnulokinase
MSKLKRVLAFDFGASSGRAMLGIYDGETIELKEIHRFSNEPVIVGDTMYWDTLRLFHEIKQGLLKAKHEGGFESVAIDTWGVDFGLLDMEGKLIENPIHYRDTRTQGMIEEAFSIIQKDEFYKKNRNTIYGVKYSISITFISKKSTSHIRANQ